MDIQAIKAMVEALRGSPSAVGVTRDPGQLPRRISGESSMNSNINYSRYKRQQAAIGESPVSYKEWMSNNAS